MIAPEPFAVSKKILVDIAIDNATDGGKFANFMFERDGTAYCHVGGFVFALPNKANADEVCPQVCAAVQRERQAAKAEALLDLAAWCATVSAAPNAIGPLFGAGVLSAAKMIGAEATSRAERAGKGEV